MAVGTYVPQLGTHLTILTVRNRANWAGGLYPKTGSVLALKSDETLFREAWTACAIARLSGGEVYSAAKKRLYARLKRLLPAATVLRYDDKVSSLSLMLNLGSAGVMRQGADCDAIISLSEDARNGRLFASH